jgi:hypothetical protein
VGRIYVCLDGETREKDFWYGGAERVGYLTGSAYEGFASWVIFFCAYIKRMIRYLQV